MARIYSQQEIVHAYSSFKYHINNIYPDSFTDKEPFKRGDHIDEWADMMQRGNTCIVSSRKHSKSLTAYAYLQWEIAKHIDRDLEILYISYDKNLARYHIHRFKRTIAMNPFFKQLRDLTPKNVEGIAKYTWDGKHTITLKPGGILTFERGKHPDILILDDVLADPANALNFNIIDKINTLVKEVAFSLPKEGGHVIVVGTTQTPVDFFYDLKHAPHFQWGIYPAIKDLKSGKPLWPEMYSYNRLMQIKNHEIGNKAFDKEYMCKPVWSADSFFNEQDVMDTVNSNLKNYNTLRTKNDVGIGWDIGKHSHPAYVTAFEFVPIGKGQEIAVQRHVKWLEGWEYYKQLDYVKGLVERLRADWVNFDNTRGELEGFYEKGQMDKSVFFPINFNVKTKSQMATEYEKRVHNADSRGNKAPTIQHINHRRSINQVLVVTNDLQAVATHEGHGDSFWGNALALLRKAEGEMHFLEDPDNVTGLF